MKRYSSETRDKSSRLKFQHKGLKDFPVDFPAGGKRSFHEHVGKVVPGVETIHLGGLDEAVHQESGLRPILAAMSDPVLRSQFYDLHQAFTS
jgi:hypothetical protein